MTEWVDLNMGCPVLDCPSGTPGRWRHRNCGGIMEISDTAYLRCKDCGDARFWNSWGYSCEEHPLKPDLSDCRSYLKNLGKVIALRHTDEKSKRVFRKASHVVLDSLFY